MNARALLFLLILTMILALSPRYRRQGLVLSAILLVLMLWQFLLPTKTPLPAPQGTTSAPVAISTLIPAQSVLLNSVVLSGNGAPWRLVGELTNQAKVTLREVKLVIERRVCKRAEQAFEECLLLWQGEDTLQVKIAPNQTHPFDVNVWSHDPVPAPEGLVRDRIQVVAATSYGQ